jgi:hypothetical protein
VDRLVIPAGSTREYPFRAVRPHEPVWLGDHVLHTVVEGLRPNEPLTGCGFEIAYPTECGRACDFPGHELCPDTNCFGDLS